MNLRLRFALLFSLFVFIILTISVTSIFLLYERFRQDEFYSRIEEQAITSSRVFLNEGLINNTDSQYFHRRMALNLAEEKMAIYDSAFNLLYVTPDTFKPAYSKPILTTASATKSNYFNDDKRETVVLNSTFNGTSIYIVASAFDKFGRRKMLNLRIVLFFTLVGGLVLSGLFAFFYVRQIVKPLGELTNQMQHISESNLDARVKVGKNNNELSRIARNFNDMLDRLENAFEMRKSFVQHASHELRTPLSNMMAQTEAALSKELSTEESHRVLRSLREDQQHLIELTNSLLILSKYEKLPSLSDLSNIRVDEVLYAAIDELKSLYPNTLINVDFINVPDDDGLLTVMGNDVLLQSALQNLVKNACHYSEDGKVNISIDATQTGMKINFENAGKQLSEEEKEKLFIPFFRGENSLHKKGYGLGLSIVQRIIHLHKGTVLYSSTQNNLNRFSVYFPH